MLCTTIVVPSRHTVHSHVWLRSRFQSTLRPTISRLHPRPNNHHPWSICPSQPPSRLRWTPRPATTNVCSWIIAHQYPIEPCHEPRLHLHSLATPYLHSMHPPSPTNCPAISRGRHPNHYHTSHPCTSHPWTTRHAFLPYLTTTRQAPLLFR